MFADLSRVVIVGSRWLGKRVERQDDGSRTDFKKKTCVKAVLDGLRGWEWQHNIMR